MNDLNRASLDAEIERQHNELAKLDPTSPEYKALIESTKILMDCANQDDKIHNEARISELQLDANNQEVKSREKSQLITNICSVVSAAVSAVAGIFCYHKLIKANDLFQQRSIDMEERGFAHTDRSDKWLIKPQYPRV